MKRLLLLAAIATATGCGGGSDKKDPNCNQADPAACGDGLVCEVVQGVGTRCAAPVVITGVVYDLSLGLDAGPIEGARVVPLDVNGAPVGSAATTDVNGAYSVQVPAERDANLAPVSGHVTLRADADGFATFPSGIRSAVPVDLSAATEVNAGATQWVVASSLTDVGLEPTSGAGTGRIHGNAAQATAGALVVAERADGTVRTGVADASGDYVIFNVPTGDWTVQGYTQGVNYQPAPVAGLTDLEDRLVNLAVKNRAAAAVTGSIQPTGQNQPATLDTTVVLVVRATYDLELDRGESPPGLVARLTNATGTTFHVAGVPDGEYTVLAAFGTDGYIRDVSGIGGTAPVEVLVENGVMTSAPGAFKITGAVSFADPGISPSSGTVGETLVTDSATPTFAWKAYPSATGGFDLVVFDSLGTPVWAPARLPAATLSTPYAGAALEAGRTYQVRVTAYDVNGNAVSRTEDLLGVFTYVPPAAP